MRKPPKKGQGKTLMGELTLRAKPSARMSLRLLIGQEENEDILAGGLTLKVKCTRENSLSANQKLN